MGWGKFIDLISRCWSNHKRITKWKLLIIREYKSLTVQVEMAARGSGWSPEGRHKPGVFPKDGFGRKAGSLEQTFKIKAEGVLVGDCESVKDDSFWSWAQEVVGGPYWWWGKQKTRICPVIWKEEAITGHNLLRLNPASIWIIKFTDSLSNVGTSLFYMTHPDL